MPSISIQNGHFLIDGQPQLIQAGEFHYFRAPVEQWPSRLQILKDAGFNALATYIPWLWHEVEEGSFDLTGETHPMRDLAGYLDLAAEMDFWIIARPGPYIMAETINEGVPPWVFAKYSQVAAVDPSGSPHNIASYMHPVFRDKASAWYRAVFEVLTPRQATKGGKIIMVQLDNEMGMIHWLRNLIDTNPDTVGRFAEYLHGAYGTNLSTRYPASDLPAFLLEEMRHPTPEHGAVVLEDYRRFYRGYLRQYAEFLWAEARACGMDVLPVINIHGFGNGGKTFPIGLSQLVEVMRIPGMVSATDVYPLHIDEGNLHHLLLVNEMTKALHNPEQALFSIEFQAGGDLDFGGAQSSLFDLHTRLSVSVGMRAINHYLFADGENHPILSPVKRHDWGHAIRKDGTLRRHYYRYPKLSRVLSAYGDALIRAQPHTVTTIGFLLDDYMTEYNNEHTQEQSKVITQLRDTILFDMIARALALTHRPFDAVALDRADLNHADLDPAHIPVFWVMVDKQSPGYAQENLVEYARRGGKLILAGRMCEEDFHHRPCTVLKDALGIREINRGTPFVTTSIDAFETTDIPVSYAETYTGDFDEVFAKTTSGEETVGFVKSVGQGQVMVFGAAMTANTLEDIDVVNQMALKFGCQPLFRVSEWVDARISVGELGSFLFLNNYQDDPVETRVEYQGKPLFDGSPVHIAARSGLILPLDWQVREGVTVLYATGEINGVSEDVGSLVLTTAQSESVAEVTVDGQRVRVEGRDGRLVIKESASSTQPP